MKNVAIGDKFLLKQTKYVYRVLDIVGNARNVPTEATIVYLQIASKLGFLQNAQTIIAIPLRVFEHVFDDIVV